MGHDELSHIGTSCLMRVWISMPIMKPGCIQVIDGANKQLQNVITFPPNGSFIVDSSLEPEGDARHNFKFSGAKFTVNGRAFRLPPFGKGWWVLPLCSSDFPCKQLICM